jgi:hypothetical protein
MNQVSTFLLSLPFSISNNSGQFKGMWCCDIPLRLFKWTVPIIFLYSLCSLLQSFNDILSVHNNGWDGYEDMSHTSTHQPNEHDTFWPAGLKLKIWKEVDYTLSSNSREIQISVVFLWQNNKRACPSNRCSDNQYNMKCSSKWNFNITFKVIWI